MRLQYADRAKADGLGTDRRHTTCVASRLNLTLQDHAIKSGTILVNNELVSAATILNNNECVARNCGDLTREA